MKEITVQIREAGEASIATWDDFQDDGNINSQTIMKLIGELVDAAETVIKEAKRGELKHHAVKDAFYYFDDKYDLLDKLDDMIDLPLWLEPFDRRIIAASIDLLIVMAVTVMNRKSKSLKVSKSESRNPPLPPLDKGGKSGSLKVKHE